MSINAPLSASDFTDVIWIQTGFIGDIILTTAAMKAMHNAMPEIRQHLVTTKIGAIALAGHPLLASTHIFSKREGLWRPVYRTRKSIRSLALKKPIILQPHKSLRSTLLSLSLGYPLITFKETAGASLAWRTTPRVAVMHETDRIALLLEALGLPRESLLGVKPTLPPAKTPDVARPMTALSQTNQKIRWIGLTPGSVWATKRWPMAKFATLAQLILDLPGTGVVLLGSPEEQALADDIEAHCLRARATSNDRIMNLCGKTSLAELNGIYPMLSALVSNDSSPIHYASAFNVPTVAIFGATVPSMGFAPLADRSVIAEVTLKCRPCGDHGPSACPLDHFKCMNDLQVPDVLDKLKAILAGPQKN